MLGHWTHTGTHATNGHTLIKLWLSLISILAPLGFISNIPLNVLAQWMNSIQQLGYCNFSSEDTEDPAKKRVKIDLRRLADLDPVEHESHFGICPIPLYAFTAGEVDLLNGEANLDDVREVLRRRHLLQYFFPADEGLISKVISRFSFSVDLKNLIGLK